MIDDDREYKKHLWKRLCEYKLWPYQNYNDDIASSKDVELETSLTRVHLLFINRAQFHRAA